MSDDKDNFDRLDDKDEFAPFWTTIENPYLRKLAEKYHIIATEGYEVYARRQG